jgi:hypothetical protein
VKRNKGKKYINFKRDSKKANIVGEGCNKYGCAGA